MQLTKRKISLMLLSLITVLSILIGIFGGMGGKAYANPIGLGDLRFTWDREIYNGVTLNHTMSYNNNKDQKSYTVTFNPKTSALKPVIAYNGNVMYGSTMSSLVSKEEQAGNHVVFGFNGDAYDTSNGVSNGIMINNGKLITSSNASLGWGFLADGSVVYGSAALEMTASIAGGETLTLRHINKERKLDTTGIYLLTEDFNNVTASTEAGVEVVLVMAEGQDGIHIGQPLTATVEEVKTVSSNSSGNQTAIESGKMILSTHKSSPNYEMLTQLSAGTEITVNVNDVSDSRIDWSEVVTGMGIFHLLLDNGTVPGGIYEDTAIHPRTAMGIKADGTVVLMQNDGRQVGWANGISFKQMVEYMRDDLDCVTVFNFDGGGSSTISATLPGDSTATMLNKPSDGHERANTNAILFVATEHAVEGQPVEKLHIYPNMTRGYATKAMLLEKGKLDFTVKVTDSNFYPVPITETVQYSIENSGSSDIGTVDENGKFTANAGTGTGKLITSVGGVSAEFAIEVVDSITSIETDLTIISVAPSKTLKLDFRAYKEGVPVVCSSEALSFSLNPESLGSVQADGTFTATEGQGTGHLNVSYKDYTLSIPVEVGKQPMEISEFEIDFGQTGNNWTKYYTNIPSNGGWGNFSINRDERYIKSGDGSLQIDYDFATKPLTGTVAIEIGEVGYTTLEGQPTAIGCWVYGDGNGGWFRIQMSGGVYAGSTYVTWTGWKYIETPIPTNAPFPYKIQRAVRLLGTASVANHKKGTIYVDSLRAIYDFRNDDIDAPAVVENSIYPSTDSLSSDLQQEIGLTVKDQEITGRPYTGIDMSRTQMYINNKLVDNLQQALNADGSVSVSYHPGALTKLRPGVQIIRVRTEDNFGNKTFTEWSFTVEGYAVQLTESKPQNNVAYAGQSFTYGVSAENYKNFGKYDFQLSYNKEYIELIGDPIIDNRLTVTDFNVDRENGVIDITVLGMENVATPIGYDMFSFNFKAKTTVSGTTGILVTKSSVTESDIGVSELPLSGYDVNLDYRYILSKKGVTYESQTQLSVTDLGAGVLGATFEVLQDGNAITFEGVTDADGTFLTDFFCSYPIGTVFAVTAIKDGFISNQTILEVLPSLGSLVPQKIAVTVGEDASTSVGIGWQTAHEVTFGEVIISTSSDMSGAQSFTASKKTVVTTYNGNDREYTAWGVFIKNLTADTVYYYQVGSVQGYSNVASFKTAKASGDMNIAFYGDIQGGYNKFPATIQKLMELYNVEMSILAGDVADNSHVYQEWTDIDTYTSPYLTTGIWSAVVGNHDVLDDAQALTGYFYGPDNGVGEQEGARNYWFTIGDAIFYNFDTEANYSSYDSGYELQKAHLKSVMNASNKKYKIVIMHRSAYPLRYDESEVRALSSTFEECGIDLVLSGHDHIYSRTSMLAGNKASITGGVTYVVGGSGSGSKYYDADLTRPWLNVVYDNNNPIFTILKFREKKLVFEAYAIENGVSVLVDTFEIGEELGVSATTDGNGSVENKPFVRYGSNDTFTTTPNTGYHLATVTVNGNTITVTGNTFTVENITGALTIAATFKLNIYDIIFDSDKGSITGDDAATHGESKTFTVTADQFCHLVSVTVNGEEVTVTHGQFTIDNITEELTIVAIFEYDSYEVKFESENGSISGDSTAMHGSNKTFTVTPSTGYHLISVTLNGEEVTLIEGQFTVENITGALTIVATFEINSYDITFVSENGIITGDSTALHGDNKAFTVTSATGYHITSVTVNSEEVTVTDGQFTVENITGVLTVAAKFELNIYDITFEVNNGSIIGSTAIHGSSKTFTVTPMTGYHLKTVTVNGEVVTVTDGQFKVENIAGALIIAATFESNVYDITFVSENGTVTGDSTAIHGSSKTFTVTPMTGYHLKTVTVNGTAVSFVNGQFTVENITEALTVAATFELNVYTITFSAQNGSLTGSTTATHGQSKTFTITAEEGYILSWVKVNDVEVSVTDNSFTITVTSNLTITAEFTVAKRSCTAASFSGSFLGLTIPLMMLAALLIFKKRKSNKA